MVGAALNAAVPVIIDGSGAAAAERPNAMIVATSPDGLAGPGLLAECVLFGALLYHVSRGRVPACARESARARE